MRRTFRGDFGLLCTLMIITVGLGPRAAAGRTIAVPDDVATIGAAMAGATAGDIILVGCGTYNEHDIQVKSGVSLWSGTLQSDCVVIDAGGRGRVLVFADCDSTTAVVGFTLRGGATSGDGGAVFCRNAAPRLSRCVIRDSRARRGGGLACEGTAAPRLEDCTITGNEADLHGGGLLWNSEAGGRLSRCSVTGNRALAGGGLACLQADRLHLTGVRITANAAAASGGGVWIGGGAPQLDQVLISGNDGGLGGSALACRGGLPSLVSCTVVQNVNNDDGDQGSGLLIHATGAARMERTIVAFNTGVAATVISGGQLFLSTCNVFGHPGGDWVGSLAAQANQNGNFSLDPRFCERSKGNFKLSARSPCLPGNRAGGVLVGAGSRGCP